VETVLFLAALSGTPGGSALATLAGSGLGFMLAALFGVLLVRGSLDINLHRFFTVTGLVLLALVAKLVASGLHEFFEASLLPSAPLVEETVELFATRTASLVILGLLIAVPLGGLAWDRARTLRAPAPPNGART
jgi:FTR1 family protein